MNQRPRSRKRNMVSGNVSQIKRKGEGLGLDNVDERVNFITRIIQKRKDTK